MGDRLTLEQRRVVASLMEVYGSPTVVRQKFAQRSAGRNPPSRLTIYRIYANIILTNPVYLSRIASGLITYINLFLEHTGRYSKQ